MTIAVALVMLALGSVASLAASITLNFSGTVTKVDQGLTDIGVVLGDRVSGKMTFNPANTDSFTSSSFLGQNTNFFAQTHGTYSIALQHGAAPVFFTHSDALSAFGRIDSSNNLNTDTATMDLFQFGNDSALTLNIGTTGSTTLLTSLNGFPSDAAGIIALLGGSLDHAVGAFLFPLHDSFEFSISPTPTPVPAALPLFASALGGLGLLRWRKRNRGANQAAA
jgi:hypothetical protein